MLKNVLFDNPTIEEISQSYKALVKQSGVNNKVKVYFSEPVMLRTNKRKVNTVKDATLSFFDSTSKKFCYTHYHSTGYPVKDYMNYDKIIRMEAISYNEEAEKKKALAAGILKTRYDEKTWPDLTAEDISYMTMSRRYMKAYFPTHVLHEIEAAFKEKKNYSYTRYTRKNEYKIETRINEDDGDFRAWFVSEVMESGRTTVYFLLNPTFASFGRRG